MNTSPDPIPRRQAWLAAVLLACVCALANPAAAQRNGSTYWYHPPHDPYHKVEFFAQPSFNSPQVHVTTKRQLRVDNTSRGWIKVRLGTVGESTAYVHISLFRSALYVAGTTDLGKENFKRSSIFEEDPDVIEKRLDTAGTPAAKQSTTRNPPWRKYRDNWPSNQTSEAPKKKYIQPLPDEDGRMPHGKGALPSQPGRKPGEAEQP